MTTSPIRPTSEETQSIEVDYELPDPPEKVWRALTEPALLEKWLMKNDIKPEVGHRFHFQAAPIPGQWDGRVACEILAVEPRALLRYSWKGGNADATKYGGYLDSTVTWTLEKAANGGTKLHLSHAGFTAKNAFAFEMMGKGWRGAVAAKMSAAIADA